MPPPASSIAPWRPWPIRTGVTWWSRIVEETPAPFDTRVRIYRLRPQPMAHLKAWLEETERLWSDQLLAFKAHLEKD